MGGPEITSFCDGSIAGRNGTHLSKIDKTKKKKRMLGDRHIELKLNRLLNLPATGNEQDWEIELSNPERVVEFIDFANSHELEREEMTYMVALIIASYSYFVEEKIDYNDEIWSKIVDIMSKDKENYKELVSYWCGSETYGLFNVSEKFIELNW